LESNSFKIVESNSYGPFSTAIHYGFWKAIFLWKLLRINENAWEFELNSPFRARLMNAKISKAIGGYELGLVPGGLLLRTNLTPQSI
jgi:hypothetical protein